MYRRRNEIERLFRRLKGFRRIFSRFDKLIWYSSPSCTSPSSSKP
jgi:transposase